MADPRVSRLLAAWQASVGQGGWLQGRLVHGIECPCRLVREPARFPCNCGLREWERVIAQLEAENG